MKTTVCAGRRSGGAYRETLLQATSQQRALPAASQDHALHARVLQPGRRPALHPLFQHLCAGGSGQYHPMASSHHRYGLRQASAGLLKSACACNSCDHSLGSDLPCNPSSAIFVWADQVNSTLWRNLIKGETLLVCILLALFLLGCWLCCQSGLDNKAATCPAPLFH